MEYTLTPAHVHKLASDLLIEQLELTDYKRTCPARTLLSVLFAACARLTGVSAAVDLLNAPSPETVRKAFRANTPEVEVLEARINDALRVTTPTHLGARQHLAIDLTLTPYHGTH
jgi:hypothetical protein